MNLRAVGCNFRTAPVTVREQLAFTEAEQRAALAELSARLGAEAVFLCTCNRVELFVARNTNDPPFEATLAAEFLAQARGLPVTQVQPLLYTHADAEAVRHLCRVAGSLDSLIVGEGQIAGQVKQAYELAHQCGATGPFLNALFPHVLRTAKRVRTQTGISQGHVSISSVAVDYVRQVFEDFSDKTVLVIGAGKMGRLTLKHLQELKPGRILVTNRSLEKAETLASECAGTALHWDRLDDALIQADIVLSTTGALEPIVPASRFRDRIAPRRISPMVVLDIAVPRDFDPAIHDGDSVCLFNVDDLTAVREQTLATRRKHIAPAEAIIDHEVHTFLKEWNRRRTGPLIGQLTAEVDRLREEVTGQLFPKLNGKLSAAERAAIEYHFRLFQSKLLHGPIAALQEASREGQGHGLGEVIKKVFRLGE